VAVVTGTTLINRIRQRADQVNSGFVSDSEILNWIGVYQRALDDLLIRTYGADYSATSCTFSATAGTANYSLSALTGGMFYKGLGLDIADTSSPTGWRDVKPYNWHDRNQPSLISAFTLNLTNGDVRYRFYGTNLNLAPTPSGTTQMKLWYCPQTAAISLSTDQMDDVNGWSEYIVIRSAIAIKDKEESDTSILQADLANITQRIIDMAPNRDAGEAPTVGDMQSNVLPFTIIPWR